MSVETTYGSLSQDKEIILAEHDGTANVAVKKVGMYAWDTATMSWVRISANGDGELVVSTPTLSTLVDLTGGNIIYLGEAAPASVTGDPVWRIQKIDTNTISILYAVGATFNNKWDDRATTVVYA